jgi:NADPH:quinone reductase-like Zn-dependent oxidoreductase
VGPAVKEFATGDEVFGSTGFRFGAYAEFISRPESARMTQKPKDLSFVEAAGITDGGLYALGPLRAANVKQGDAVLVYGASGAIGTASVQLAKNFGADVTAVTSTKNLELVKSLGPDHVIDYTKDDFTKNGQSYDVIFDAVGKHSFARSRDSLKPGGRFLPTDGAGNLIRVLTTRFQDKKVIFPGRVTKKDVVFLKELIEAGRFRVVIDRTYGLQDVVEAHRYVDTEQKVGNVILTVAG